MSRTSEQAWYHPPLDGEGKMEVSDDILLIATSEFDLSGMRCLLYIVEHAGWRQQDAVTLSLDEFCHGRIRPDGERYDTGTQLSHRSAIAGIHELHRTHVIEITTNGAGRAGVRTYRITPPETWQFDVRPDTPETPRRLTGLTWGRIRAVVFARDNYTCRYCGQQAPILQCDHVMPLSRGGSHDLSNLVTACRACNLSKHNKTLEEWQS